jgi:hypothetical protein
MFFFYVCWQGTHIINCTMKESYTIFSIIYWNLKLYGFAQVEEVCMSLTVDELILNSKFRGRQAWYF